MFRVKERVGVGKNQKKERKTLRGAGVVISVPIHRQALDGNSFVCVLETRKLMDERESSANRRYYYRLCY